MKYHVYAALIASTNAGQFADNVNHHMPTEAETKTAEEKVEKWLNDFEGIVQEAKPAVEARNRRIKRAYIAHEKEEEEIWVDGVEDLEKAQKEYEEEVMHAQAEFENTVHQNGAVKEWEELVQEVQTEMEGCKQDMMKIRLSAKTLKSNTDATTNLSWRHEFHEKAPTPDEVEDAETIINGWFERREGIMRDAKPGIEARDKRIMRAWERAEKEEQEINDEMIEDLVKAQRDFEDEVMDAEHNFEEELTQNGVVADWRALEQKVDNDIKAMKKLSDRVISLKKRHAVFQKASFKLNTNLARMSDEMAHNSPKPEEYDAVKVKVTEWFGRFEAICDKVAPAKHRRDREIMDATEDRAEEVEDTVGDMFEDWDKNDREFFEEVEDAEDAMLRRWETQGTTAKIEKLGDEIEASLEAAHRSMLKIKSNMQMRKQIFGEQNLAGTDSAMHMDDEMYYSTDSAMHMDDEMDMAPKRMSEHMKDMPDGQKVKKTWDTVVSWVKEAERIDAKAEPAARRRERALEDATEDRFEEVVEVLEDTDKAHKKKEERFWEDVVHAQEDFEHRMEQEGIAERDRQLGRDIENQFNEWGKNMKRDNLETMQALKSLESDIDSVLATL